MAFTLRCDREDFEWTISSDDWMVDYGDVPMTRRFAILEIDSA
jgi:hypothetical protein